MSMDVFRTCVRGYLNRLFDQQIIGVQQGYWAGYFGRAKKPKSLKSIIEKLLKSRLRKPNTSNTEKPEVDVEAFKLLEERFKARQNKIE